MTTRNTTTRKNGSSVRSHAIRGAARYLAAAAFVLFSAWSTQSSAFVHVVQPGDTLASLAERIYGKIQHERLLVAANSLEVEGGIRIVAGMRLEVPALSYVRVSRGQTWKELAARLLGGEHRAHALAAANDSQPWLPPPVDAEVVVPYNLRFVSTGNETVVGLAYRFLGDRKAAWMLDQYNQRQGRRLVRGEVVLIPVTDIVLTEAGLAAAAEAQQLEQKQLGGSDYRVQRRVAHELEALHADVRHGHYVQAVRRGAGFLAMGELQQQQRARIHRLLLEAYVALRAHGLAAESCTLWREAAPDAKLDPKLLSPKILAACEVSPE